MMASIKLPSAAALALAALLAVPAAAQTPLPPLPPNPNITIDYMEPVDPTRLDFDPDDPKLTKDDKDKLAKMFANYEALKGVREGLMRHRLLERFALFLTPLKLPTTLRLRAKQCDEPNAFYNRTETSITMCYEYIQLFERIAPKETTPQGITRDDAILGAIISTMLHETGHALFSIYRIPVLGREEDGADQLAGFVMLQFGTDVAQITIKGAAWKWLSYDWSDASYHGVHSTAQARFYNYLCLGYGGNPQAFQKFVDLGWLPKWRAPLCQNEYNQVKLAFEKTIGPHLDLDLVDRVQNTTWLQTEKMGAPGAPRISSGQKTSRGD